MLAALKRMRSRDEGMIIQIGSALAYRSIPLQSAYCAAKAAVRGFTDSLRTELIHHHSNIGITMLQLPAVNTPQVLRQRNKLPQQSEPVPPMYKPEAIADLAVWAAEKRPREVLIGWPTLQSVWGQRIMPAALDVYLGKKGYASQMADVPNRQNGHDMLFTPLTGDPGAHGPYRDRERGPDLQMRVRPHLRSLAVAGAAGCLAAIGLLARRES